MKIITNTSRIILTVFVFFLYLNICSAQVQVPIQVDGVTRSVSAGARVSCTIMVEDTATISQIQVQLGTMQDSTDLANYSFDYDVTTGLPTGYSYSRNINYITLKLGLISDIPTLFGQVRIKDLTGNWGNYFKFIAN